MSSLLHEFSQNGLCALLESRHETQSSNSVREHSPDPIPVDLLIEIFSRVPLKSIARFHCLSKFLASILRRHDFTELFLTKSLTRPRLLFTVKTKGKLLFYSSPQPHNPDDNSSLVATSYHPTLVPDYQPTYICKPGTLEGSFVIVWFDVRPEKFGFINKDEDMLPKPNDYDTSPSTLFNYKDKLGIHCLVEENLVLWVLEDAGNHKWSKHSYVLSPLGYHIVSRSLFFGMTSTGEIVYSWNSSVWFYNIEKNTIKRVNIQGLEELEPPTFINNFLDYVENMKFL
uniref:F-box domain-containing protein n=1 Tax=Brassica oleracea var. oleracea TaxID=109376 RepID=A0A0D3BKY2_BRAOL